MESTNGCGTMKAIAALVQELTIDTIANGAIKDTVEVEPSQCRKSSRDHDSSVAHTARDGGASTSQPVSMISSNHGSSTTRSALQHSTDLNGNLCPSCCSLNNGSKLTLKQKGPYTSTTPPNSALKTPKTFRNGYDGGDSIQMPAASSKSEDVLQLKVPLEGSIWRKISSKSFYKSSDISQTPINPYLSSGQIPFAVRDSEIGLHFRVSVSDNGIISVHLRGSITVEFTNDYAVRAYDGLNQIILTLSNSGNASAIIHPNGRIHQSNSRVDVVVVDGQKRYPFTRYARIWHKGISFTNENSAITYLVDSAGARTTTDHFFNPNEFEARLNGVFLENSLHGFAFVEESFKLVNEAIHQTEPRGTEVFYNDHIRISQNADGHVHIERPEGKGTVIMNSSKGSVSLNTTSVYCTASLGRSSHMYLRRGDRRIHFNGSTFCVRNAGHSAGFDARNQFKIFN